MHRGQLARDRSTGWTGRPDREFPHGACQGLRKDRHSAGQSLWEQGRQAGLSAYCTPPKAYDEGRSGRGLSPVCPAAQLPALQLAHGKGMAWHRLSNEINVLDREMSDLHTKVVKESDEKKRAL
jgi:hypothetical protein